jgi:peptidylprolyl isomerase domain and WD repeat-containing protein 1
MHRDTVHFVLSSTSKNLIITASIDGHLKFWRKSFILVEFVKNFKAHSGFISAVAFNKGEDLLVTCGVDKTIKIFDVLNCDLRTVLKLNFSPLSCDFIPQK